MDQRHKYKIQIYKPYIRKYRKKYLCDPWVGKDFLNVILKEPSIKEKNDKIVLYENSKHLLKIMLRK